MKGCNPFASTQHLALVYFTVALLCSLVTAPCMLALLDLQLPPIIFNSGYHIERELFFRHIVPICLFACVGTVVATFVSAGFLQATKFLYDSTFDPSFLELLAFGALISATDPVSTLAVFQMKRVDPHLFYLVFGESVINDAVGLVLFEALAHVVEVTHNEQELKAHIPQFIFDFVVGFAGSTLLGIVTGLAVALFFKKVDMQGTPLLELCLFTPMMYLPFVLAELCKLSGIVTVLFAGVAAKRYIEPNLSRPTAANAVTIFRLVAHMSETVIFLELGLSVFSMSWKAQFHGTFILLSLLGCLLSRACNIYPVTFIYNNFLSRSGEPKEMELALSGKEIPVAAPDGSTKTSIASSEIAVINDHKIPWKTAHMLWFSGLRGAVSYALVRTFPDTGNQTSFALTTMLIVLLTTFLLGGTTEIVLNFLGISVNVDEVQYMESIHRRKLLSGRFHRFETYQLRRWVIRDFTKEKPDLSYLVDDAAIGYQEHIEMTDCEHFQAVHTHENETTSVYDFGNYSTSATRESPALGFQ